MLSSWCEVGVGLSVPQWGCAIAWSFLKVCQLEAARHLEWLQLGRQAECHCKLCSKFLRNVEIGCRRENLSQSDLCQCHSHNAWKRLEANQGNLCQQPSFFMRSRFGFYDSILTGAHNSQQKKRKNKADKNARRRHIIVNIIAFCSQDSGVLCRGADLINLLASCGIQEQFCKRSRKQMRCQAEIAAVKFRLTW